MYFKWQGTFIKLLKYLMQIEVNIVYRYNGFIYNLDYIIFYTYLSSKSN